ncbi:MAG TPA: glycoside hydrolase family 31, partial [Cytophagales bacterium]|nr:glycoside hydrolase family 31 [Cytophagales bacterium]
VEGFWNDMNEIATWGNAIPENLEFNFEGHKATSRRGRNLYGMQMARSTYEGTKKLMSGKRPFNLTRSGFAGIQRYSAIWTGDNVSYDDHMMLGIRIVNSLGLSGVAFAGYDTGGFVGEANSKLFARWISIASLSPFFRTHSMINTRDSEPWSYGEEVENISRNYIKFRYQLMPYIYSLFYEASQSGMPIQRSLAINYTHDHLVYNGLYQHQYLFGPNILVAPVESFKELVKVYFPEGDWYNVYTGKIYSGNQEVILECPIHQLPVFVKAGSILPMQKSMMNTSEKTDELILHVYPGNRPSEFVFYMDDGETFQYQQGESVTRKIYSENNKVYLAPSEGKYQEHFKTIQFIFHGLQVQHVNVNGEQRSLERITHSFFSPLEKYDPINEPDSMGEESVTTFSMAYTRQALELKW